MTIKKEQTQHNGTLIHSPRFGYVEPAQSIRKRAIGAHAAVNTTSAPAICPLRPFIWRTQQHSNKCGLKLPCINTTACMHARPVPSLEGWAGPQDMTTIIPPTYDFATARCKKLVVWHLLSCR